MFAWDSLYSAIGVMFPIFLFCVIFAILLSGKVIVICALNMSLGNFENASKSVTYIFSFSIIGAVIGFIIRLMGGFSLGSASTGQDPDIFQFIATMLTSFAGVIGGYLGERNIDTTVNIKPIGTGSLVFMIIFGYLYYSDYLGRLG